MKFEIDHYAWSHIEGLVNSATLADGSQLKLTLIPGGGLNGNDSIDLAVIPPTGTQGAPTTGWVTISSTNFPGISPSSQPMPFFPWSVKPTTNPVTTPDTSIPEPKPEPKKEIDYSKITKSLAGK